MSGAITGLAIQKNNKEWVNVFINEAYAFSVTLNTALTLEKGQYLNDDQISELKQQAQANKAYDKALHYLSYRARTKQEIRQHLKKKDMDDFVIEETIERLSANRYVDDLEFGRAWLNSRANANPKSKRVLEYELRQKGVDQADIEQILSELDLDEEVLAWDAIAKKLYTWQKLEDEAFKKKITGHLGRRGFNYEIIKAVIHKALLWKETDETDEDNGF